MAVQTSTAEYALKILVDNTSMINDVLLLSQWIISPSLPYNKSLARSLPSPYFTSILYGLFEPFCTRLWLWLGFAPWLNVLATSPFHLMMSAFGIAAIHRLIEDAITAKSNPDTAKPTAPVIRLPRIPIYIFVALPVVSAAARNAGLVLFSQSMNAPLQDLLVLGWFALLLFVGSHGADYWVGMGIWRAQYVGHAVRGVRAVGTQISCLVLMLATKAATRYLLGQDVLVAFKAISQAEAEVLFAREKADWLRAYSTMFPAWVWPLVSISAALLSVLGNRILERAD